MFTTLWNRGIQAFLFGTLLGLANLPAQAGSPMEAAAERLEDKIESLEDVIDDRFERSPEFKILHKIVCRMEDIADDLDEAIEDDEWPCAIGLLNRLSADISELGLHLSHQQVCHVPPQAIARAMNLAHEIDSMIQCLMADVAHLGGPGCVVRPISEPVIQPVPYPVYRMPVPSPVGREHRGNPVMRPPVSPPREAVDRNNDRKEHEMERHERRPDRGSPIYFGGRLNPMAGANNFSRLRLGQF